MSLSFGLICEAHGRIRDRIHRTPVLTSEILDARVHARLFFKCENFQKAGSFKSRGAANAVFSLDARTATRGVATHSSGNHAAALARAAALRGIKAHIVMPSNAPKAKQAAVRRYGGEVVLCEPTLESRETTAARVVAETGATFIHPYNDLTVMAGQGTAAKELMEEVADLDLVLCPVGGGGLLSGTAVATKSMRAQARVIAAEPLGANDAYRSFRAGTLLPAARPNTIADGLLTSLGDKPFAVIRREVDDIVTVSDEEILFAMRQVWEILKIVIEPSSAVPLAALLHDRVEVEGRRVGVILTGGNLDLDALPWLHKAA